MISIILIILAGLFNAAMDILKNKYHNSIFKKYKNKQWIDPTISWKNKWKNENPIYGNKFFLSSTLFVFITDLWHLFKTLMIISICLSIVFYNPIFKWYIDVFIFYLGFTLTFELFYSKILIKL